MAGGGIAVCTFAAGLVGSVKSMLHLLLLLLAARGGDMITMGDAGCMSA